MRISVFGLGYVGCVTGACLADIGNYVIGVDSNVTKISLVNEGKSPVIEAEIQKTIEKVVKKKLFIANIEWKKAVGNTEIALICVGTPSCSNGNIDLRFIKRVCQQIGKALKEKSDYFVIVIRSTILPGTVENVVIPILEKHSGKFVGKDFGVCMVPEFLREGSSIYDFYHPPKTVIGEYDERSGDVVIELFNKIDGPLFRTQIKVAEMLKYADNSFHALKVTFANEIGNICKELKIDSHKVMEIFCMDKKLNLSPYYLKPGFAFGGSCLPKDLRAISYQSKTLDVDTPVLNAILESNKHQTQKIINKLLEYKRRSLGFLGLSFKGGTDDLRESPIVEVVETMLGKGFNIKIYDNNVSIAKLIGANKEYIIREIPHISALMCSSVKELIRNSEVLVVGHYNKEYIDNLFFEVREHQVVVDLVRAVKDGSEIKGEYYGICW